MTLGANATEGTVAELPAFLHEPFCGGAVAVAAAARVRRAVRRRSPRCSCAASANRSPTQWRDVHRGRRTSTSAATHFDVDDFPDDDDVRRVHRRMGRDRPPSPGRSVGLDPATFPADDSVTEPLTCASSTRCTRPRTPGTAGRSSRGTACSRTNPSRSWIPLRHDPRRRADERTRGTAASTNCLPIRPGVPPRHLLAEPIGFAHNGFHVDPTNTSRCRPRRSRARSRAAGTAAPTTTRAPTAGTRCGSATELRAGPNSTAGLR